MQCDSSRSAANLFPSIAIFIKFRTNKSIYKKVAKRPNTDFENVDSCIVLVIG